MRAHLEAIRDLLTPAGWPVDLITPSEGATPPYLFVWAGTAGPGDEIDLTGERSAIDTLIGVTHVAGTAVGVYTMRATTLPRLTPEHLPRRLEVPGRSAWLRFYESRPVEIDRDVSPHPAYGVDLYELTSTPT